LENVDASKTLSSIDAKRTSTSDFSVDFFGVPVIQFARKGDGQKSGLAYLGHALMENRNGLVVVAEATLATGTAEREAAAFSAAC
jgi:hypothetical protein